jgi:hypothetical protein
MASEEWETGGVIVLDVEPLRVPPFVGLHGGDGHVLLGTGLAEIDPGAPYWGHQSILLLTRETAKKYLQSSK